MSKTTNYDYTNSGLKPKEIDVDVQSVSSVTSSTYNPDGPRIFHCYNDSWISSGGKIYDTDKSTCLYDYTLKCRKPQVTIRNHDSGNEVGKLEFSTWTRKMHAEVDGTDFDLTNRALKSWKSCDVEYQSQAFGQKMTWKRSTIWVLVTITLLDENQLPIAKFTPVTARKKLGRIEFMGDRELTQEQIDEVVFTGMSVMQDTYFWTTQNAGVVAASGAGA